MSNSFAADPPRGQPRTRTQVHALPFADLPRLELEKLLGDVSARAADVLATQGRLRDLLHAHAVVAGDLDLQAVLRHVVTAARELVQARYAALGVIGENGLLDEFVHTGMDTTTVERIGELPHGRGILGLLTSHPVPVRLDDLAEHPAAVGFPPNHPAMDSFLGVPIRIGDRVFGNLYLTGSENGRFSAEDEQLAVALAATAGVAIDNARLYQESEQRHRWLAASTTVTRQLFAGHTGPSLDLVLRTVQDTAYADFATLALVDESGRLRIRAVTGVLADHVADQLLDPETSLSGQVIRTGAPVLVTSSQYTGGIDLPVRIGSVVVVPLVSGDQAIGAVSVGRLEGRRQFAEADVDHIAGFAGHAGVALEFDRARVDRQDRLLGAEHDRIGLALNEQVIQKLFTVGIGLNGLLATNQQPLFRKRVTSYIDVLDDTIAVIRRTVFDLANTALAVSVPDSLQHRILTAADEQTVTLGFPVLTTFTGRFDSSMPLHLADDVLTVIRAGLAAIAGHVHATEAELRVSVKDDLITAEIMDNGVDDGALPGVDGVGRFLDHATHNGHHTPPHGGTHLIWTSRTSVDG